MALTAGTTRSSRGERHLHGVPVARADIGGNPIEIVESRATRWLFDPARRRFLRVPRDMELDVSVLAMPWQRYSHRSLDDDGNGIVVTLDGGRTLRLYADQPVSGGRAEAI